MSPGALSMWWYKTPGHNRPGLLGGDSVPGHTRGAREPNCLLFLTLNRKKVENKMDASCSQLQQCSVRLLSCAVGLGWFVRQDSLITETSNCRNLFLFWSEGETSNILANLYNATLTEQAKIL